MAHLNRREPTQDGHGNTVGAIEIAFHLKPKVLVRVETKEIVEALRLCEIFSVNVSLP